MVRRQQAADRAERPRMRSPGTPPFPREVERLFWIEIAKGLIPAAAAAAVGASQPVGQRRFHNAGGMPPFSLEPLSGRYLRFQEREEIALLRAQGNGVRQIARAIGRDPSTISRELRRNAATRSNSSDYRASVAQWKAELTAKRPKPAKLVTNPKLRAYVEERLSGQISQPNGVTVTGPPPPRFTGNGKPHRKHRAWTRVEPRADIRALSSTSPMMRACGSATRPSIRPSTSRDAEHSSANSSGVFARDALRAPRERSRRVTWAHVTPETLISERPAEVEDRAVPGHWEGDLLIGLERSAIGTVVERTTRFTTPVHLPREEGYRHKETSEHGPALGGYGAITIKNALTNTMSTLPTHLALSLTWDRGKEMSAHAQFKVETGISVFFDDSSSP